MFAHLLKQCKCRHTWAYNYEYNSDLPKRFTVHQRFPQNAAAMRPPFSRGDVNMYGTGEELDVFMLRARRGKWCAFWKPPTYILMSFRQRKSPHIHTHGASFRERPPAVECRQWPRRRNIPFHPIAEASPNAGCGRITILTIRCTPRPTWRPRRANSAQTEGGSCNRRRSRREFFQRASKGSELPCWSEKRGRAVIVRGERAAGFLRIFIPQEQPQQTLRVEPPRLL